MSTIFFAPLAMPRRQTAKRLRLRMGKITPTVSPPSLGPHVGGNIVHGSVVALSTGHDGLGHSHYIPVPDGKAILRLGGSLQNGLGDDLHQIVAAADNGRPDAPGNSTDHTAHK